jgi:uncharacterized protein (TIGR02145 family)
MKKIIILFNLTFLFIVITSADKAHTIKNITFGTQIWMKENLSVEKFKNGDIIPEAQSTEDWGNAAKNQQPAWCYVYNSQSNGVTYGKLYNWYAVNDPRGLAPEGWHIPSKLEFVQLSKFVKGNSSKLRTSNLWKDYGNIGTDDYGFSALPGGGRFSDNFYPFDYLGKESEFWSSTESESVKEESYSLSMTCSYNIIRIESMGCSKSSGYSVRCVKNKP